MNPDATPALPDNPVLPDHVESLSPLAGQGWAGEAWHEIGNAEHFWTAWRMAELLRMLERTGPALGAQLRCLDVGGGTGTVRRQLEAVTAWTVDVCDLDPGALARTVPGGQGRTLLYDVTERHRGLTGCYDVVSALDVIEHVRDAPAFLDAAVAHLRPGGVLMLNVPALSSGRSAFDDAVGHLRRYDEDMLRSHLPDGLDQVTVRPWGLTLVPALYARKVWLSLATRRKDLDATAVVKKGFGRPSPLADKALRAAMRAEMALWDPPPVGTSLLAVAVTPTR